MPDEIEKRCPRFEYLAISTYRHNAESECSHKYSEFFWCLIVEIRRLADKFFLVYEFRLNPLSKERCYYSGSARYVIDVSCWTIRSTNACYFAHGARLKAPAEFLILVEIDWRCDAFCVRARSLLLLTRSASNLSSNWFIRLKISACILRSIMEHSLLVAATMSPDEFYLALEY